MEKSVITIIKYDSQRTLVIQNEEQEMPTASHLLLIIKSATKTVQLWGDTQKYRNLQTDQTWVTDEGDMFGVRQVNCDDMNQMPVARS